MKICCQKETYNSHVSGCVHFASKNSLFYACIWRSPLFVSFAAFFLHSVVGEYKASTWKLMGAAIRSFFSGLFFKNRRMKTPVTWAHVLLHAQSQQRSNAAAFQGALHTIKELAKMFHKRFLRTAIDALDTSPFMPAYIAFIQALVAQWMNPHKKILKLNDPSIPRAKKIFYYNVFAHRKLSRTFINLYFAYCCCMQKKILYSKRFMKQISKNEIIISFAYSVLFCAGLSEGVNPYSS